MATGDRHEAIAIQGFNDSMIPGFKDSRISD